jgi:hypothetical protein
MFASIGLRGIDLGVGAACRQSACNCTNSLGATGTNGPLLLRQLRVMQNSNAPVFEKHNQHFVPQFWQRNFADNNNQLYGIYRASVDPKRNPRQKGIPRPVSTVDTMTQNWTYTVFTPLWQPSDEVEDALAKIEGDIKNVISQIVDPAVVVTPELRERFCAALALTAVRLPHVMARGHRRAKELAWALCKITTMERDEFIEMLWTEYALPLSQFGYEELRHRPLESFVATAQRIDGLSPQDWSLPQVEGLLAFDPTSTIIEQMDLSLVEARSPECFVLGDTPMPDSNLAAGFTVPLTRSWAVVGTPAAAASPSFTRRRATPDEIEAINSWQAENFLYVMVGPDPSYLAKLAARVGGVPTK